MIYDDNHTTDKNIVKYESDTRELSKVHPKCHPKTHQNHNFLMYLTKINNFDKS